MKSLVVYESLHGNTEKVARAVADGLGRYGEARAVPVDEAARLGIAGADFLVVGAPTHAWGLPSKRTWAGGQGPQPDQLAAGHRLFLREWLSDLPAGGARPAAAFSTRLDKPRLLTGSAAGRINRRLRHHGWARAAAPASFVVTANEGPLKPGEIERAAAWGAELGAAVTSAQVAGKREHKSFIEP